MIIIDDVKEYYGKIDPMNTIAIVKGMFTIYTIMIFARIALSWFPTMYRYPQTKYLLQLTDPYMNIFRKVIPPIGGVLDLSPMLAFISLRFLETFVLRILR